MPDSPSPKIIRDIRSHCLALETALNLARLEGYKVNFNFADQGDKIVFTNFKVWKEVND